MNNEQLVQRLTDAVAYELELSERGAAGAANAIREALRATLPAPDGEAVAYGCHCDLEPHMEPDGCVIDTGRRQDCFYARSTTKPISKKEECEYWQPIKFAHPTADAQSRIAELEALVCRHEQNIRDMELLLSDSRRNLTESREREGRMREFAKEAHGWLLHCHGGQNDDRKIAAAIEQLEALAAEKE